MHLLVVIINHQAYQHVGIESGHACFEASSMTLSSISRMLRRGPRYFAMPIKSSHVANFCFGLRTGFGLTSTPSLVS